MNPDFQNRVFTYAPCAEQQPGCTAGARPVVIVGAGPVGLATAIDLAQQGVAVVVLDDDCTLSTGSRAICFSKRSLEIFDRLGCGDCMVDKGVSWNVGKVYLKNELLYSFDLLPETGHRRPAFINLQQYYVEGFLVERALALPNIELRWKNKVTGLTQDADGVTLTVETPDGAYTQRAQYVVAADGSRSPVRRMMGLEAHGQTFKDRFLIADVRMEAPFPSERWFWFDPPFHPNQSVLLHHQPDNVWRIDFQLGWDADPVAEKQPERVIPRVRALLGEGVDFELEWVSVYTFSCERMDRFRHGRVLFIGDAAHRVSPFGARGANSGLQDAENLAWKLRMVLAGDAPDTLLDTYATEREFAADDNIRHSTRSTDFITPKSAVSRLFRDAALRLAKHYPFARTLVNSGRLSTPTVLEGSPLSTPDDADFGCALVPGSVALDAPVRTRDGRAAWLLSHLRDGFMALRFCRAGEHIDALPVPTLAIFPAGGAGTVSAGVTALEDIDGLVAQRYDARPGTLYLIRPDQHVCARWRSVDTAKLAAAMRRAMGHADATTPSPATATA
ncbi:MULTISPECIES: FAD-dependent oxidoreductase [Ralstonia]|uniref:3-(3-hydroxy-phenyl)propionate/3-hydroxycinnamic acid hydroxylase n=1 Tax=Ralstonia mannitolilytica TaxID=105219 RepID=A0AAJ5D6U6_9RALS|nr:MULTISPECIES: FAD-dependent oxidoreductase [Ralstonia]AJW46510.1 FAD-dependent oxidoreductase [Ralstonia mannitolilytica]PLT18064.1 FAD-dependent oxidoreductase [Ralstonia mannitolilytica]QIF09873.1 FAD-dependent oxidoreductase [Ralstonia mannitolilytica]CAG2132617.1 3-(3-hydroxy-phenyl)propionate/3-hydroxycinnamic acid hydroxylase [Ralstonia mannitolilytica]CAJ0727520.1 3-(3-hydroxy-phenyl)propionate/3-hydroxycinnamic acid hydroxylase [Ralstonia mannitolilytica]